MEISWGWQKPNKLKPRPCRIYLIIVYKNHGLSTFCLYSLTEISSVISNLQVVLDLRVDRLHVITRRMNFLILRNLIWHFYCANWHMDITKCALGRVLRLPNYILSLHCFIYSTIIVILLHVFILTHPVDFPCGGETGACSEIPRLSVERRLTLFTWVYSEILEVKGFKN
jgi:hypothetical protein